MKYAGVTIEHTERKLWKRAQLECCPRCDYCDTALTMRTATVDHVLSRHRFGSTANRFENWALACESCNKKKGSRHHNEVGMVLLRKRYWPIGGCSHACGICGKRFGSVRGRIDHEASSHGIAPPPKPSPPESKVRTWQEGTRQRMVDAGLLKPGGAA